MSQRWNQVLPRSSIQHALLECQESRQEGGSLGTFQGRGTPAGYNHTQTPGARGGKPGLAKAMAETAHGTVTTAVGQWQEQGLRQTTSRRLMIKCWWERKPWHCRGMDTPHPARYLGRGMAMSTCNSAWVAAGQVTSAPTHRGDGEVLGQTPPWLGKMKGRENTVIWQRNHEALQLNRAPIEQVARLR